MLEKAQADRYLALRRTLIEKRFSKMNDMQRAAVLTTEGPLLILAGAGSGKTTVLINRIANLLLFGRGYKSEAVPFYIDGAALDWLEQVARGEAADDDGKLSRLLADSPPRPWEIMAITFTNKAAAELKSRLSGMLGEGLGGQVHASTFHSACVRILRADIDRLGYRSGFAIYDSDDSQKVIKDLIKAQNLDEKQFAPRSVLSKIGEFKDLLETPAQSLQRAEAANDFRLKKLAGLYRDYQKRLFDANALDFDDIITLTVRLFDEHPDVLSKYQHRYRYVMVDEYQDTNRSQYKLVSQLAGGSNNLCVVGDDDQSIYSFRGATIENILSFEQQYEGAKVIRLEQNYRSTQNILTAANEVIAKNTARKGKTLWTAAGDGDKLVVYTAYDERDEAGSIADTISREHDKGRSYSDCAVLYRMNAQSQTVESALVSAGIPYKVVGGTRFFDRKEIRDMVAYLSVLHNPADALRLMRIINEPKRGIGDATVTSAQEIADVLGCGLFEVLQNAEEYAPLQRKAKPLTQFATMMNELMESSGLMPLDELLDELLDETGYREMVRAEGVQGQTRLENIEELKTTMKRYEAETEEPSLGGFLEEVALYTDLDSYDAETDSVTLMTMHAAKGLEFPLVFLPGMEEGLFPSTRAFSDPEQLEEERRLAYVGITRAKEKLMMLTARRRMLFGQTIYGQESRFLRDIDPELLSREGRKPTPAVQSTPKPPPEPVSFGAFGKTTAQAAADTAARSGNRAVMAPKPAAPSEKADFEFIKGDRVIHRVFGGGTIISVTPMGGDHMIEVRFDRVGVKKIMATFARLQKL
ncbi:MAG TPA: UvrD-helicase domain-containing protein [Clostridia bacterium]|nr:UvrD-helicase domain-containing protein [Clostridia bacterium]